MKTAGLPLAAVRLILEEADKLDPNIKSVLLQMALEKQASERDETLPTLQSSYITSAIVSQLFGNPLTPYSPKVVTESEVICIKIYAKLTRSPSSITIIPGSAHLFSETERYRVAYWLLNNYKEFEHYYEDYIRAIISLMRSCTQDHLKKFFEGVNQMVTAKKVGNLFAPVVIALYDEINDLELKQNILGWVITWIKSKFVDETEDTIHTLLATFSDKWDQDQINSLFDFFIGADPEVYSSYGDQYLPFVDLMNRLNLEEVNAVLKDTGLFEENNASIDEDDESEEENNASVKAPSILSMNRYDIVSGLLAIQAKRKLENQPELVFDDLVDMLPVDFSPLKEIYQREKYPNSSNKQMLLQNLFHSRPGGDPAFIVRLQPLYREQELRVIYDFVKDPTQLPGRDLYGALIVIGDLAERWSDDQLRVLVRTVSGLINSTRYFVNDSAVRQVPLLMKTGRITDPEVDLLLGEILERSRFMVHDFKEDIKDHLDLAAALISLLPRLDNDKRRELFKEVATYDIDVYTNLRLQLFPNTNDDSLKVLKAHSPIEAMVIEALRKDAQNVPSLTPSTKENSSATSCNA